MGRKGRGGKALVSLSPAPALGTDRDSPVDEDLDAGKVQEKALDDLLGARERHRAARRRAQLRRHCAKAKAERAGAGDRAASPTSSLLPSARNKTTLPEHSQPLAPVP